MDTHLESRYVTAIYDAYAELGDRLRYSTRQHLKNGDVDKLASHLPGIVKRRLFFHALGSVIVLAYGAFAIVFSNGRSNVFLLLLGIGLCVDGIMILGHGFRFRRKMQHHTQRIADTGTGSAQSDLVRDNVPYSGSQGYRNDGVVTPDSEYAKAIMSVLLGSGSLSYATTQRLNRGEYDSLVPLLEKIHENRLFLIVHSSFIGLAIGMNALQLYITNESLFGLGFGIAFLVGSFGYLLHSIRKYGKSGKQLKYIRILQQTSRS